MRSLRPIAVVLIVSVLLAACGGGGDTYGPVDEVPDDAAAVVTASNLEFDPTEVEIETGDRVAWVVDDGVIPHNVRFPDDDIGSENLREGEVWARRFTRAGTYEFVCTLHPRMRGTVTVR